MRNDRVPSEKVAPAALGWLKAMRNAGKLTLGRAVQAACSLVYLALAARALGPEGFGTMFVIHSLSLAIAQLARFESWQSIVRFGTLAIRDDSPSRLRRLVNFGLALDLSGIVLGVVAYAIVLHLIGPWLGLSPDERFPALLYGLVVISALNSSGSATGLLHLLDRFGSLAVAATIEPIIRLVGAVIVFYSGGGLEGFLLVWMLAASATHLTTIGFAFVLLGRRGTGWGFRFQADAWIRPVPGMLRYALGTQWVGAIGVAHEYLPMLATGGVIGSAGAGLLKVARQFPDVLSDVTNKLLVPALFPEFSHLKATAGRALVARLNIVSIVVFSLVFLGLVLFGKNLITLFAGSAFLGAYATMLWLGFAGVVGATSFSFETLLTATGAIRRVVWANSISLIFYLGVLAVLLRPMGIEGVGMAAVAYATARSTLLWWSARQVDRNSDST